MTIKLEYQEYLFNNGVSNKELKETWLEYSFKFNFISEEFERDRKKYKYKDNPLKVENHPIIVNLRSEEIKNESPNTFLDFINTEFSLEGCIKFASKHGLLGIESNFKFKDKDEKLIKAELLYCWLWELANVRNVLSLIIHKQKLSVDKFSKYLKIDLGTGLWEFENNRSKTNDVNFPIYILPTANFETGFNKELIRFKENLNSENMPQVIDDILSVIFYNFYRDRVKPIISSKDNKFSSEVQPVSLIGYIWHELFKIVENNNIIRNCRYCKKTFTIGIGSARSDKVYCSNSCVVNGTRTEAIFKRYEKDFQKKGYYVRKSGGNTDHQFDYWLINKYNVLIGGIDIAQSQISEFSQKWDNQCKIIESKLNANNLPIGMQLIGNYFSEARLLQIAHQYQQASDWHLRQASEVA